MGLNNVVLGIYLVCIFFNSYRNKRRLNGWLLKGYFPIFFFFVLAFIASVNNTHTLFLKHLESYWSFLLIPIAFSLQQEDPRVLIKYALKGLIYGCAATLLICYANAIFEIITFNEPWSYFLRWRHLSHDFTEIADTHPAYLGLFICFSTYCLLFQKAEITKSLKLGLIVLFSLGMLQLASRMALLMYIAVLGFYFFKTLVKNKKQMVVAFVSIGMTLAIFYVSGSNYLKDRLFSIASIERDDRFQRLQVSYDIFEAYPILGVGFDKVDAERIERYTDYGYIVAAHFKYNAHNQFMEYLSINGILGGLVYVGVLVYLISIAVRRKSNLFLFFLVSFVFTNLTESMMVRIKGIEYFALFVSIFLLQKPLKMIKAKEF